jgi:hypothetical protein
MMKKYVVSTLLIIILSLFLIILLFGGYKEMSETNQDQSTGIKGSFKQVQSGLPVNWILYTPKTVPTGDFDLILDTAELSLSTLEQITCFIQVFCH